MNDYAGKICPFCKTEFAPDDEIVVCSDCEMPHHIECWKENQGCTTFGCPGTIKTADSSATTVTQSQISYDEDDSAANSRVIYCTKCGAKCNTSSSFCSMCGNRLITYIEQNRPAPVYTQSNPANTYPYDYVNPQNNYGYNNYQAYQPQVLDSDIQQLIEINREYYVPKFQAFKAMNKKASWNWMAFLFSPYWLIYRKMYGYGAGLLGIAFVLSLIDSGFLSFLSLIGYIVFGIFANFIYMRFLEKKAEQAKALTEPYKTQFIIKNGGTNVIATVLTVIGYALLILIIFV